MTQEILLWESRYKSTSHAELQVKLTDLILDKNKIVAVVPTEYDKTYTKTDTISKAIIIIEKP